MQYIQNIDAKNKRRMRITSKRPLALLLLLASAAASGMYADGGEGGGGVGEGRGGECDAENACYGSSCDDTSSDPGGPPPALGAAVEANVATATETGDDAGTVVRVAECVDKEPRCALWGSQGECEANPDYMLRELRY